MPRLALKIGSRNFQRDWKEGEQEEEKEKNLIDKIRKLRKTAGKRVGPRSAKQAPKRRKLSETQEYLEVSEQQVPALNTEVGEKRKQETETDDTECAACVQKVHTQDISMNNMCAVCVQNVHKPNTSVEINVVRNEGGGQKKPLTT